MPAEVTELVLTGEAVDSQGNVIKASVTVVVETPASPVVPPIDPPRHR